MKSGNGEIEEVDEGIHRYIMTTDVSEASMGCKRGTF
jgi:hypothetical protein